MTRQLLMNNVYLTYIPSEKFKTSFLSAQMAAPLEKETAGRNALLVNVLQRGGHLGAQEAGFEFLEIGRASCRERVSSPV